MTQRKKLKRLVRARAARTGESYSTSLRHLRARKTEETTVTDTEITEAETFKCSFCGKSQEQVKRLIAGPGNFICDECVALCAEIISDETDENEKPSEEQLASVWAAMLRTKGAAASAAEKGLTKLVRQARAKGLEWPAIADALGVTPEDAASRWGGSAP